MMNNKAISSVVSKLRNFYPEGTVVKLLFMNDTQAPPSGTNGVVTNVDNHGVIHVDWDNGSDTSLIYGEDKFAIVKRPVRR